MGSLIEQEELKPHNRLLVSFRLHGCSKEQFQKEIEEISTKVPNLVTPPRAKQAIQAMETITHFTDAGEDYIQCMFATFRRITEATEPLDYNVIFIEELRKMWDKLHVPITNKSIYDPNITYITSGRHSDK